MSERGREGKSEEQPTWEERTLLFRPYDFLCIPLNSFFF